MDTEVIPLKTAAMALLALALAAPASVSAQSAPNVGGSTQVGAQSGCMNQWMFNGVWRVRVTNVAFRPPGDKANAWLVTMQWGNGTSYAGIAPGDTLKQTLVLALTNGDTLTADDSTTGHLNESELDAHSFPAAGQFTHTQMFVAGAPLDPNNKPAKLLVTFDVAKYKQGHPGNSGKFWTQKTSGYNYRIDLTCGGST